MLHLHLHQHLQLAKRWFNNLGKGVARPVQARLHGAKVAMRDLADLLVRTPFQLTKDEHFTVVLRQGSHQTQQ